MTLTILGESYDQRSQNYSKTLKVKLLVFNKIVLLLRRTEDQFLSLPALKFERKIGLLGYTEVCEFKNKLRLQMFLLKENVLDRDVAKEDGFRMEVSNARKSLGSQLEEHLGGDGVPLFLTKAQKSLDGLVATKGIGQ